MENRDAILRRVRALMDARQAGLLGGAKMPEDENPGLDPASAANYMYFTLPMALNYQRSSYMLWECANRMYRDGAARIVFDSRAAVSMPEEQLREILVRYKVALQPHKQPLIWRQLCRTVEEKLDGDIRTLFSRNDFSVQRIKETIAANRRDFPYLGGTKILNYWLYVLEQYTDARFTDRECITVAPDTHVIQASRRLGVLSEEEAQRADAQLLLAARWSELLQGTEIQPIDVHTPLWLWSHGKFAFDLEASVL